jgi:hypothetical protein
MSCPVPVFAAIVCTFLLPFLLLHRRKWGTRPAARGERVP